MNLNSLHIGLIINNNDPEQRGRVQVFIPHLSTTLYDGWNKEKKDISFRTLDPEFFTEDIIQRLIDTLPWAEVMMPFFGGGSGAPVAESDSGAAPTTAPTLKGVPGVAGVPVSPVFLYEKTGLNSRDGKIKSKKYSNYKNLSFKSNAYESLNGVEFTNQMKGFLNEIDNLEFSSNIVITEGVRSKTATYGADNSNHKIGQAVDIRANLTPDQLKQLIQIGIEKYGMNEIGTYYQDGTQWIHIGYDEGVSAVNVYKDDLKIASQFDQTKTGSVKNVEKNDLNPNEEANELVITKDDGGVYNSQLPGMGDGGSLGMFSIPAVGSKAYVMFLNGHHMMPIVMGSYQEPSNVLASGVSRVFERQVTDKNGTNNIPPAPVEVPLPGEGVPGEGVPGEGDFMQNDATTTPDGRSVFTPTIVI